MIYILSLLLGFVTANEIKATEAPEATVAVEEKNANDVLPVYEQIDNKTEKAIQFSWGTVFYTSLTGDDHGHANADQTHLNVRYTCKNGKKSKGVQRYQFCGYAKSEENKKEKASILFEMKKAPENKGKTDAELLAIYDNEYNLRIVDPVKNISDVVADGKPSSVEITVRQKAGRHSACESKITTLTLPVDCQ